MTINLKVLDLSHHNNVGSFAQIKASGIVGVILKCTQGTGYTDPTYAGRVTAARAAGLLTGAYHFNTGENTTVQVDHFMAQAKPDAHTLMALDWEDNAASNMGLNQCVDFLGHLDEQLSRKAVIYSGNRAKDTLGTAKNAFLGLHRLWLAQYSPVPRVQASWQTYWLWQYDDGTRHRSATVAGVGEREDRTVDDRTPHDGYDAEAPHGFDAPAGETDEQRLGLPGVGGQVDLNSYNGTDQQLIESWAS